MTEIIAPEGQLCVNRKLRQVGYIVQMPDEETVHWELLPEADALALDQVWHPASTDPLVPPSSTPPPYDRQRTSREA